MDKGNKDFLIVNNIVLPIPAPGMTITTAQAVDAGRNANNQLVGQKVGRRQWKINNLSWNGLTPEEWTRIKAAIEDFQVPVTFTGDDNRRHTVHMYPGDTEGRPFSIKNLEYTFYETCKFNLIDCGWDEEGE